MPSQEQSMSPTRRLLLTCGNAVRVRLIVLAIAGLILITSVALAQVSVITQRYDNSRAGQNVNETYLTPANVKSGTFEKLFAQPVDGYIVGHPLYLPGISIPGAGTHNVVYVATMHDSVYAFDADNNAGGNATPLWQVSFTNPAAGITSVPIKDQACPAVTSFTEIGVVPTMVIDPAAGTIYVLAKTEESGAFVHRLHALDVTTGEERPGSPVQIKATFTHGDDHGTFVDKYQMARPGLVLANGTLYVTFGTLGCRYAQNASGWVVAYDPTSLTQLGAFATNPNQGYGAGIWQGGVAPAADSAGNLYFNTADGPYGDDDVHFGDTLLKLALGAGLNWVDYFTPYNQQFLNQYDLDLGSGGVVLLPDQSGPYPHLMAAVGKQGTIYLVSRDNLGKFNPNGDTQIVQELTFVVGEVDGAPAYWNNTLFVSSEGSVIKAFSLANGQLSTLPIYQSSLVFNMPAGMSVSSNGTSNGIVWAINGIQSKLYAYNASNLVQTYNSSQVTPRDTLGVVPHFSTPIVANGKVYIGGTAQLVVYGLIPHITSTAGNLQTATVGTVLPTALQIKAADAYQGAPISGLAVSFSDNQAGGSFGTPVAITDQNGFASTTYTLPTKAMKVTITAGAPGYSSATLTETATAGTPASVVTKSGFNQTASVNSPLPNPVCAVVKDQYANKVPGVVVNFSDGGAGGILSPSAVTTDSTGSACTNYTTPSTPGTVF